MKTLLIIGHTFPEPNTTAAGTRMLQLIVLFQEMGFNCYFGSVALETVYSEDLEAFGVSLLSIQLNHSSFDEQLKKIRPDVVLFDRFMTEEQFGWRVHEQCPNGLTVLDTEDLHFLRKAREESVKKKQPLQLYTETTKRELASILRCDMSLIISEVEFQLLTDIFSISPELLNYLPLLYESPSNRPQTTFEEREHFIILGNFMHAPNSDAIRWLKESIWTKIKKALPEAECHVYGAYIPKEMQSFSNPKEGFLIKGWAENKEKVLQDAKVVLAPLRFGAGLKGKVLDGFAMGTPVVTTAIGAEGIIGDHVYNGVSEKNAVAVATKAVAIYSDKEFWEKTQQQGFEILKSRFLKEHFEEDFKQRIEYLMKAITEHRKSHFLRQILHHESLQSKKYMSRWIELKNKS